MHREALALLMLSFVIWSLAPNGTASAACTQQALASAEAKVKAVGPLGQARGGGWASRSPTTIPCEACRRFRSTLRTANRSMKEVAKSCKASGKDTEWRHAYGRAHWLDQVSYMLQKGIERHCRGG